MSTTIPANDIGQLLKSVPHFNTAQVVGFEELLQQGLVPADLQLQPDICLKHGQQAVLVHFLTSGQIPEYVIKASDCLKSVHPNTYVLILARHVATEKSETSSSLPIPAPYVAAAVAEEAHTLGCGVAFEWDGRVHFVFVPDYVVPAPVCGPEEPAHLP